MYKIYVISGIVLTFLFFDWHSRFVFVGTAYPRRYGHGKTGKRAHKHYKANWSLTERLLWLFVFKEPYEGKYRAMAYLSYIHFFFTIITICWFEIWTNFFPDSKVWAYEFLGYGIFTLARYVYDNAIGKGDI